MNEIPRLQPLTLQWFASPAQMAPAKPNTNVARHPIKQERRQRIERRRINQRPTFERRIGAERRLKRINETV